MGAIWLAARSLLSDAAIFQRSVLTRAKGSWGGGDLVGALFDRGDEVRGILVRQDAGV